MGNNRIDTRKNVKLSDEAYEYLRTRSYLTKKTFSEVILSPEPFLRYEDLTDQDVIENMDKVVSTDPGVSFAIAYVKFMEACGFNIRNELPSIIAKCTGWTPELGPFITFIEDKI